MNIAKLVNVLEENQITLSLDGDQLTIDGPHEALDDKTTDTLRKNKSELIEFLKHQRENEQHIKPWTGDLSQAFPLSHSQMCFWFVYFLMGETANNLSRLLINGDVKPLIVEKTINKMIERHESLRACISELTPTQTIKTVQPCDLPYVDLSHMESSEINTTIADQVIEMMKPVDLSSPPLIRVHLYKIAPSQFLLLSCFAHIVLDGSGMHLFEQEFMETYQANLEAKAHSENRSKYLQISDFVAWERDKSTYQHEKQLSFWKNALESYEFARFPDEFIATESLYHYDRSIFLPAELLNDMEASCSQYKVTLQMYMICLMALVIHNVTGKKKFVINSILENRVQPRMNTLLAPSLYVMPIPIEVKASDDFESILHQVKSHMILAFENIDLPFSIPQGILARKRWKRSAKLWADLLVFFSSITARLFPKAKMYPSYISDYCLLMNPPNMRIETDKKNIFGFKKKLRVTCDPVINVNMLQSFYKKPLSGENQLVAESLSDPQKFLPEQSMDGEWEDNVINFYITADSERGASIRMTCSCLNESGVTRLEEAIKSIVI